MATVKTYSVTNDVIGRAVNDSRLHAEIADSGLVLGFNGVVRCNDELIIDGASITNVAALDTLVRVHVAVTLDELKAIRCEEVDNRSVALLENGFTYDGRQFSLSMEAQINWIGLKEGAADGALAFPLTFSTLDNTGYTMQSAAEVPMFFWGHMVATREGILQSGRVLKAAIMVCQDVSAVSEIVDER